MKRHIVNGLVLVALNQCVWAFSGAVAVLPMKSAVSSSTPRALTEMIIAELFIRGCEVLSYQDALRYTQKPNARPEYILESYLESFNKQYIVHFELLRADTKEVLVKDRSQISLVGDTSEQLFILDPHKLIHRARNIQGFTKQKNVFQKLYYFENELRSGFRSEEIVESLKGYLKQQAQAQNRGIRTQLNALLDDTTTQHLRIHNQKVYDLVGVLVQRLLPNLGVQAKARTSKSIELVFLLTDLSRFREELEHIKQHITTILGTTNQTGTVHSIKIGIAYEKDGIIHQLPLTTSIQHIYQYLHRLSTTEHTPSSTMFTEQLRQTILQTNWSNHMEDERFVFMFVNKAIQRHYSDSTIPEVSIKPIRQNFSFEYKQNPTHARYHTQWHTSITKHMHAQGFRPQSPLLESPPTTKRKQNHHNAYTLETLINQVPGEYELVLTLTRLHDATPLHRIKKHYQSLDALFSNIDTTSSQFAHKSNALIYIKGLELQRHDPLITTANLRHVHVYSIGCSGIDKESEAFLHALMPRMKGEHIPVKYSFPLYQDNGKVLEYTYTGRNIYADTNTIKASCCGIHDSTQQDGEEIAHVEDSDAFLRRSGYLQGLHKWSFGKVTNNIHTSITDILQHSSTKFTKNTQLTFTTQNHKLHIRIIGLSEHEKRRITEWRKSGKDIIIVSPTFLFNPYTVEVRDTGEARAKHQESQKVLYFGIHYTDLKIISPEYINRVPSFMTDSVDEINNQMKYLELRDFHKERSVILKGKVNQLVEKYSF